MKIFCIQNNLHYFKNIPEKPVYFLKPESCLIRSRQPFFIPEFSQSIIPVPHVVIKISRLGKAIQPKFGHLYFSEITMGLDMEAHEILSKAVADGLPWEAVKSYDASAPLGKFLPLENKEALDNMKFQMFINNKEISSFTIKDLKFGIHEVISKVSENITLKMGDLIFAGGPESTENIKINDVLDCYINEEKVLSLKIK